MNSADQSGRPLKTADVIPGGQNATQSPRKTELLSEARPPLPSILLVAPLNFV
jgi:hypothetical protein